MIKIICATIFALAVISCYETDCLVIDGEVREYGIFIGEFNDPISIDKWGRIRFLDYQEAIGEWREEYPTTVSMCTEEDRITE